MPTVVKIKIVDDKELRAKFEDAYEKSSQIKLCKYALSLAKHILKKVNFQEDIAEIAYGFFVNEQWQNGNVRQHDVRQAGFAIHRVAKSCDNLLIKTALRVVGQAVATAHVSEHALVASDYAIKVANIISLGDYEAAKTERMWQIAQLNSIEEI